MRTPDVDAEHLAIDIRSGIVPANQWGPWTLETYTAYWRMRKDMERQCNQMRVALFGACAAAAVFFLAAASFLPFWRNPCPF